jgi:hypothetical protein
VISIRRKEAQSIFDIFDTLYKVDVERLE